MTRLATTACVALAWPLVIAAAAIAALLCLPLVLWMIWGEC